MPESGGSEKIKNILEASEILREQINGMPLDKEMIKIVVFSIADRLYAFYGSSAKRILPCDTITPVPGCPEYISGIINVRGDIESVINLRSFLELPPKTPDNKTRIVIAETSVLRSGILVDSVDDVLDVPADSVLPPVSTLDDNIGSMVGGELNYYERIITLLDINKIFDRVIL